MKFLSNYHVEFNVIGQVVLGLAICLYLTFGVKFRPHIFNLWDGVIFLVIIYITSIQRFKILFSFNNKLFEFDIVPLLFFLVLVVYLINRQLAIGLEFKTTSLAWKQTLLLSLIWTVTGLLICIKLGFITYQGVRGSILQIVVTLILLLYAALIEEIFFRGIIFNYLNQLFPKFIIIPFIISVLIFGFTHFTNGGIPMVIMATLAGIFITLTYVLTKNIFCATFVHVFTNSLWIILFTTKNALLPIEDANKVIRIIF